MVVPPRLAERAKFVFGTLAGRRIALMLALITLSVVPPMNAHLACRGPHSRELSQCANGGASEYQITCAKC